MSVILCIFGWTFSHKLTALPWHYVPFIVGVVCSYFVTLQVWTITSRYCLINLFHRTLYFYFYLPYADKILIYSLCRNYTVPYACSRARFSGIGMRSSIFNRATVCNWCQLLPHCISGLFKSRMYINANIYIMLFISLEFKRCVL